MPRSKCHLPTKIAPTNLKATKSMTKKKANTTFDSTTNDFSFRKVTRNQLVDSLAAMGILTPSTISMDMLSRLYETNIKANGGKHQDRMYRSSTTSDDEAIKLGDMMIDSTVDEHHNFTEHTIRTGDHSAQSDTGDAKAQRITVNYVPSVQNVINKSDKNLRVFSRPVVEANLTLGSGGLAGREDSDIESVPKRLRKAIIEGYNVNMSRLLLPRNNEDDDEEEDESVYLKLKTDPRLDKSLTIMEFILAFNRYVNIICEVFPQRRRELSAYMCEIIRLSSHFDHPFFYDYHRLFTQKAETMLHTRNVLVDWSRRDYDIYFNIFSDLRPVGCDLCRSPDHSTTFC